MGQKGLAEDQTPKFIRYRIQQRYGTVFYCSCYFLWYRYLLRDADSMLPQARGLISHSLILDLTILLEMKAFSKGVDGMIQQRGISPPQNKRPGPLIR